MIHLTILIPQRDAAEEVVRLVPQLARVLVRAEQPYEMICIDDGSELSSARALQRLHDQSPVLRFLRLDRPAGLSAALTAGIAAARGELVVAIEASGQYFPEQIPWLLERLARADLVLGRRQYLRSVKLRQAALQLPRRLLLGLEVRDPDCLFWAARREAIAGLDLQPGMHRFLGSLVTTRGFRAAEIHVDHQPVADGSKWEAHPSLGNLLCTWWQRRNWRPYCVEEVGAETTQRARGGLRREKLEEKKKRIREAESNALPSFLLLFFYSFLLSSPMPDHHKLTIFFSVGEPSGDLHGANLIRA